MEQDFLRARRGNTATGVPCSLLGLSHQSVAKIDEFALETLDSVIVNLQVLRSRIISEPHRDVGKPAENMDFDFSPIDPSILSTTILNCLLEALKVERSTSLSSVPSTLLEVFIPTAEPVWSDVGTWMKHGMEFVNSVVDTAQDDEEELHDNWKGKAAEFFVQKNESIPAGVPEYWLEGYIIRKPAQLRAKVPVNPQPIGSVPSFIGDFAMDILSVGKSVGLLRALQVDDFFSDEQLDDPDFKDGGERYEWLSSWPTFRQLLTSDEFDVPTVDSDTEASLNAFPASRSDSEEAELLDVENKSTVAFLSEGDIASLVQERLEPWCRVAHSRLNRVIVNDCDLWGHLDTISGLFFMKRGDTMSIFCDSLFERVSTACNVLRPIC